MQLGRGETIEDTARVLSRYVDAVMIRANRHADVVALAAAATVPVINGLTEPSHPCQIMADLQTLEEAGLTLKGARSPGSATATTSAASLITRRRRWIAAWPISTARTSSSRYREILVGRGPWWPELCHDHRQGGGRRAVAAS